MTPLPLPGHTLCPVPVPGIEFVFGPAWEALSEQKSTLLWSGMVAASGKLYFVSIGLGSEGGGSPTREPGRDQRPATRATLPGPDIFKYSALSALP